MSAPKFDGLYISTSQVKTYLRCPRQYEFRYVRGLDPAFVPLALAFGSAIHAALAHCYNQIQSSGSCPSLEEIQSVFAACWAAAQDGPLPLQIERKGDTPDHLEKGLAMMAVFHAGLLRNQLPVVLAVEEPFSIEVHDPDTGEALEERLVGTLDLVVEEAEGPVVVEHKSSAKKWTEDQVRFDLQLTAYRIAARKMGLGAPSLRLQLLTKTKQPAVYVEALHRDNLDEADFLHTVVGVLRAIDAKAFYPVRGWQCRTCPFVQACLDTAR